MNRLDFAYELHTRLKDLPSKEIEDRITFYSEMIADQMEEGLSEDEAVAAVGSIDEIADQIAKEITGASAKTPERRKRKAWEVALLVLGSPIWLSLLISAFAVLLSLYICLWVIVICCWAVFASFAGSAVGCIAGGAWLAFSGHGYTGLAAIGAGLVCAGLAIFAFYGCKALTKGVAHLTKYIAKKCFSKKEVA